MITTKMIEMKIDGYPNVMWSVKVRMGEIVKINGRATGVWGQDVVLAMYEVIEA